MAANRKYDHCNNFLRQFRDEKSNQFKRFTAEQFTEVWNHYDTDGNFLFFFYFHYHNQY